MSDSQLREWIRRYGDWGFALVAVCLALRYLWKRRLWLLAVVPCLFLMATRLHHRTRPTPSSAAALIEPVQNAIAPAQTALPDADPPQEVKFSASGDRWRFSVTWVPNAEVAENELSVFRNGRLIRKIRADQVDALGLEVKRITLPSGDVV